MSIEKELIEASAFQARRSYVDRQDYLAALTRAVDMLDQDRFDTLSNEAVDWVNAAAKAIRNKRMIAEFSDGAAAVETPAPPAPAKISKTETVELDKYGIAVGSKNNRAAQMFERGAKMINVTNELGGTYYNLLRRLKRAGHDVSNEANGVIRLTHKDSA